MVVLNGLDELLLDQAGLKFVSDSIPRGADDNIFNAHLLLPNLTISPAATLPLQCLYAALQHIAERARVGDKVLKLLCEPLGGRIVRVVQRAVVEVGYARDVIVVGAEVVLNGRDLRVKRDEAPGGGEAVPAAVRTSL